MTITIGLTGSIATGKSTISDMFTEMNIPVVDADQIAREVVLPGEPAYEKIVETFGEEILHGDRKLNREKLGEIIFSDEEKRKNLNSIIHPAIRKTMLARRDAYINRGELFVVLDIPLLFESKLTHFVDRTLVVFVEEEKQMERLMNRNSYSKEEALQRIQSQIPVKEKAEQADAVIDNNGTIASSREQLEKILNEWKQNNS